MHIICWIGQFIGHGAFEGRKPALVDNVLLTLVAPDFVVIEVMFFLGWRSESFERCEAKIVQNIEEWKQTSAQKQK